MARIVPMGIERWASFRSPERFEPAMIPGKKKKGTSEGKRERGRKRNEYLLRNEQTCPFEIMDAIERCTCHRREEDSHQQRE